MIETHAHLDFADYNADRESVIERAKAAGIKAIINVGSTLDGSVASVELANRYDFIYAACGIHPHDAKAVDDDAVQSLKRLIKSTGKAVAIGEVGIDLYRELSPLKAQEQAFEKFVLLSKQLNLPLIIHCREKPGGESYAADILFKIMKENLHMPYKGVMHCFSGDRQTLGRCLDSGLYVSYTCNITYNKANRLRDVLKRTPLNRLLLETDSPYLSPQEKRGLRNEPSYIKYLVRAIAEITGFSEPEIEEQTDKNAKGLFCLDLGKEGLKNEI
jgi:TatD DNase family protein